MDLIKLLKLDYGKCAVKGFWKYIRGLLKNDLNKMWSENKAEWKVW